MEQPGRRPTIKDVAAWARVSPATVSNVMLGRNAATREVADRVRAAALALGYVADRSASQLRSGRARVVAILVPSLTDPFFAAVIAGLERQVRDEGYDIVVASSTHDDAVERTRLAALLSWRPSGVVVIPNADDFPNRAMLDALKLPHVVVDRVSCATPSDSVAAANRAATAEAATHLLDHGHADVLVVGSSSRLENVRQRYAGVADAFAGRGLEPPPLLEVGLTFEAVADHLAAWLSRNRMPSAFLAVANFVTMGVLAHLSRAGLAVPGHVSLVGFDDYEWMRAASPAVTAIRQDVEGLAGATWAILKDRIAGDPSPARHRSVPCRLVVRDSVRRIGPPFPPLRSVPDRGPQVQVLAAPP